MFIMEKILEPCTNKEHGVWTSWTAQLYLNLRLDNSKW